MPIFDPRIDQAGAQSLADLMGGGSAAQYLGGQQAMIEQMNPINQSLSLADLDKVTIANDHQRTMNPMLQQVQRSLVREADSKTPEYFTEMRQGELGDARTKIAQAKLKEGTLDTDISAGNSKNQTQMIQDVGKNMLNMLTYVGGLQGGPEVQREAMSQLITSHGLDRNPATRAIWDRLLNSPDMLRQGQNLATQMMNMSPDHLSKMAVDAQGNASKEKIGAANNATQLAIARERTAAAKKEADAAWKKGTMEQRMMALMTMISIAEENTDDYIELPDKEIISTENAKALVQSMATYKGGLKEVGAPKPLIPQLPQTTPAASMQPIYPNGNGTGGRVPLADPLGIRK